MDLKKFLKIIVFLILALSMVSCTPGAHQDGGNQSNENSMASQLKEGEENTEKKSDNTKEIVSKVYSLKDLQEGEILHVKLIPDQNYTVKNMTSLDGFDDDENLLSAKDKISQGLIDSFVEDLEDGKRQQGLKNQMDHKKLNMSESLKYIQPDDYYEDITSYLIDADNDGIDDLVSEIYIGGTAGFVDFNFYKGKEDGTFAKTQTYTSIMADFYFLEYDGLNYLIKESYDYSKDEFLGVKIYLYEEGLCSDFKAISKEVTAYQLKDIKKSEKHPADFVDKVLNKKALEEIIPKLETNDWVILGTGETSTDDLHIYKADINNDGLDEKYLKSMFYPPNMGGHMIGEVSFFDDTPQYISDLSNEILGLDSPAIYYSFWLEDIDGVNVSYLCFYDSGNYVIYAYLIK